MTVSGPLVEIDGCTQPLRHRPLDFLGGAWDFLEKNFLALIFAKKINLSSTWVEKNNLALILPIRKKKIVSKKNSSIVCMGKK